LEGYIFEYKFRTFSESPVICFYSEPNEESFISAVSITEEVESYCTAPSGAKYFRYCTVISQGNRYIRLIPEYLRNEINSLKKNDTDLQNDVQSLNSSIKRIDYKTGYKFNDSEFLGGYYDVGGNVGDTAPMTFTQSDNFYCIAIDVPKGTQILLTGGSGSSVSRAFALLDSDNKILINAAGDYAIINNKRLVTTQDCKLVYNTLRATANRYLYIIQNKDYKDGVNPSLIGKVSAIIGSSNTTLENGIWYPDICSYFEMEQNIFGCGGATYANIIGRTVTSDLGGIAPQIVGEYNSLVTQVKYMLEQNVTPDIIFINSGMNDANNDETLGDFNAVIQMTKDEIEESLDNTVNLFSMYGAMKWIVETLRTEYPNVMIVGMIPWQCGTFAINNKFRTTYKKPIQNMFEYLGVPVIDCFANGMFYQPFEAASPYKYTLDSIHVKVGSSINAAGRIVQDNYMKRAINSVIYLLNS
jgi:lysophospholipase L1-like esterase